MDKPKLPTAEELKRMSLYSREAAKALLDEYVRAIEEFNKTSIAERRELIERSRAARRYQFLALVAGLLLSTGSLALCVYAIQAHANIGQVALALTPVGGLAGAFLLGARPTKPVKRPRLGSDPAPPDP